ncbi:hypothetical protein MSAN_01164100 [Mycena sanguinolenta]|uniref:Uncharacterized protein n=1 Tax=Mycena sanguinolenta TaxID=230812 RepID=A0A8H7D748_9AGAR|nr:hypothetical protein MSAN_01164100 [Mycena sanguinolenta]
MMNTPYNPQNEQYAVSNAPVFGPANAQPPVSRQPAPNLNCSNMEPMMNTRYNPQNEQYTVGNAPVSDAAKAQPPAHRQLAPNLNRSNTEPVMNARYNSQNEQYAVGNAPVFDATNVKPPVSRQPAPNLNRSNTEPMMNTPYNPQNEQYAVSNAPVFGPANSQPPVSRQPAPSTLYASSRALPYKPLYLDLDPSNTEPMINTRYNPQNEQYAAGNAPVFATANAQPPAYRQTVPNLDPSNTEPMMNTPYNPQNEQYAVSNAPVFGPANSQPPVSRQPAPSTLYASSRALPCKLLYLDLDPSNTEPMMNTPYNPQNEQYAVNNAPVFGPANAQPPVSRQPAPNLSRSNTEPIINTRYNPQNEQYTVGNAPVFDAAKAPPPAHRQLAPNLNRSNTEPVMNARYNSQNEQYAVGNAPVFDATNVQPPVHHQPAPSTLYASSRTLPSKPLYLDSDPSNTEPMMNTLYNPQNRQYVVGGAPDFDVDDAVAAHVQRHPNERPIAQLLQPTYSALPQPHPRARRGPAQPRPANMVVSPVPSQNNSGEMSYSPDSLCSSPEDAVPSSWSSRCLPMSKFPPEEDWSPQTPPE